MSNTERQQIEEERRAIAMERTLIEAAGRVLAVFGRHRASTLTDVIMDEIMAAVYGADTP